LIAQSDGDATAARRHLEDAVDLFETSVAPFEVARARVELARVMEKLGGPGRAIAEVDRAIEALMPLSAGLELSRARALRDHLAVTTSEAAGRPAARETGGLTAREIEVLRLISNGLSNQVIADRLFISEHTVHRHVANTLSKLNVSSRSAAVAQAARLGLL
jgi:DNA-binding NarL/FixJ family response regulator